MLNNFTNKITAGALLTVMLMGASPVCEVSAHAGATAYNTNVIQMATAAKKSPYANMAMAKVSNTLNIRASYSTNAKVVGTLKNGSVATILKKGKVWSKVQSGKVTGYIKNEYYVSGSALEKYAQQVCKKKITVTADVLRVRKKPSTNAEILTSIKQGSEYTVIAEGVKWVKININKQIGYVSKEFVKVSFVFNYAQAVSNNSSSGSNTSTGSSSTDDKTTGNTGSNSGNSNSGTDAGNDNNTTTEEPKIPSDDANTTINISREEIVEYALNYVGNPYVYGGTSLTEGADCSGFVYTIYKQFGLTLNRVSKDQAKNGISVELDAVQPGDLIFYGTSVSTITHVSMYIGDGQVVHAMNAKNGICISSMNYSKPLMARSMISN